LSFFGSCSAQQVARLLASKNTHIVVVVATIDDGVIIFKRNDVPRK